MAINAKQVMPQRNAGLVSRITKLWTTSTPSLGPQPLERDTTASGSTSVELGSRNPWGDFFRTSTDRLATYDDVEELDSQSEEASTALDIISNNATSSEDGSQHSCDITSPNARVQQIIEETEQYTRIHDRIAHLTRNCLKYGDLFVEVVINGQGQVTDLRQLPARTMYRNEDEYGNLMMGTPRYEGGKCVNNEGECAFEQRNADTKQIIAAFYPWQIIHLRWNHDGTNKYGRSHLRVARSTWKKLHAEEESLIMGRLVRALLKLIFYIDTTGQSEAQKRATVREFKQAMNRRVQIDGSRESPWSVMTDYYLTTETIPMRGGQVVQSQSKIDTIDPRNEGLQQIEDVKHFHRKFLGVLRVPRSYLGFEEDTQGTAQLSQEEVQYIRLLRDVQRFMGHFIWHVMAIAQVLQGMDPWSADNKVETAWPSLSVNDELNDAQAEYQQAQAIAILLGTSSLNQTPVVSVRYVLEHYLELNEEQIEDIMEELESKRQADLEASIAAAQAGARDLAPTNAPVIHQKEPPGSTRSVKGVDTSTRLTTVDTDAA